MSDAPPVTRFAPSPTGYLHIGGARTALFNWVYARGRGGRFLLRIEDTDRARHNEAAVQAITDGLAWLGLDWDGGPVSQYARADRHREAAEELLTSGAAFKCFMTPEETEAERERARAENRRFTSPWRDRDPAEAPAGEPYVVRLRAPLDGETLIDDAVQGRVAFPNAAFDDVVLLRSDGSPTYMLAVVVDDRDMGITHVIRGDDHLNNAGRQALIYDGFGWQRPVFAHIPLIHGPDGAKLSKRHGALGVEAYRDQGVLPEALRNYLLRLGWSHGDAEVFSDDEARAWFDLTGVNKAPARLDPDKLAALNAHHVGLLSDAAFVSAARPFLEAAGAWSDTLEARLEIAASAVKERVKLLSEAPEAAKFLTQERPLTLAGKSAKPLRKAGAADRLAALSGRLDQLEDWTEAALDAAVKAEVEAQGVGFGEVGGPARAALTAGAPAPGLGLVIAALGKAESLARLGDAITLARDGQAGDAG
ncbi:MAG: glutamate--tRNA ligase [Pseudomonadota bacterium]